MDNYRCITPPRLEAARPTLARWRTHRLKVPSPGANFCPQIEEAEDLVVQMKLLCSVGAELHTRYEKRLFASSAKSRPFRADSSLVG